MDVAAEREGLLARDRQWSAVSKAGQDIDRILAHWADDAVVYPPGMAPVQGREALREYVTGSFAIPGFSIEWTPEHAVLADDASMGYTSGTNAVTMNGDDGVAVTQHGRYLALWRRNEKGNWLCVEDVLIPGT
jgi:ketosteroid isomerase-like protein